MKTPLTLAAATCGMALLLAGCSSAEADTATSASASASAQAVAPASSDMEPSGLTGEIAYVSDGVAQLQDGSSHTAVSFTDETTFSQEVTIALADISVGSCVVVTLDDAGSASDITVTDPDDDGTCSVGFGGRSMGEMPEAMATAMPGGGDMPSGGGMPGDDSGETLDLPDTTASAQPDVTAMPGGGAFDTSTMVTGTVTAVSATGVTVESTDGEATEVTVADDATLTGTEEADASAVEVGLCMTATGESDSSGGYAATSITVFSPGDDGCVSTTSFGGRSGGMPGAPTDTDESGE